MIKTSYFANYRNFPKDMQPTSIALHPPKGWTGKTCFMLAPSQSLLRGYKAGIVDNTAYIEEYIAMLDASKNSIAHILKYANEVNTLFLCYEKSTDFCHRHILQVWARRNNVPVTITELT